MRGTLLAHGRHPAWFAAALLGVAPLVGPVGSDWTAIRLGYGTLLGGDRWHLYADYPAVQMGPLALLTGALGEAGVAVFICALLPAFLWLCELVLRAAGRPVVIPVGVGGVLLVWPWSSLAANQHPDDALVLVLGVAALLAVYRRQPAACALLLAAAVAAKPTALLLAPLLLAAPTARALALYVGGVVTVWLPFFAADPAGMLVAGEGVSVVKPGSPLLWLGYPVGDGVPWVRAAMLAGGLGVGCWLARSGRWLLVPLLPAVWRMLLEPGAFTLYSVPLVAFGVLAGPVVAAIGLAHWARAFHYGVSADEAAAWSVGLAVLLVGVSLLGRSAPHLEHDGAPRRAVVQRVRGGVRGAPSE